MKKNVFGFSSVAKKDVDGLLKIIDFVFPYICFDKQVLLKKLSDKRFFLLKAFENKNKKKLVGFVETEFFFEEKKARLNAIFVSEEYRCNGLAKKMISESINEAKKMGCESVFLLVKESNFVAKHIYSELGFCFEKMHDRMIDDSLVEHWVISLGYGARVDRTPV